MSVSDRIRERLELTNAQVAALVGVSVEYVRAVRSRYWRKRLGLPPPPSDQKKCSRRAQKPTGQPKSELHELAMTLYRWRQEGRYDQ